MAPVSLQPQSARSLKGPGSQLETFSSGDPDRVPYFITDPFQP